MRLEIDGKLALVLVLLILVFFAASVDYNATAFKVAVLGCYSPEGLSTSGT